MKDGIARLQWVTVTHNDLALHRVMSDAVYGDVVSWEFYRTPVLWSLLFFVLALFVAVSKGPGGPHGVEAWAEAAILHDPEMEYLRS